MTLLFLSGHHTLKNAADAYGITLTTRVRVLTEVPAAWITEVTAYYCTEPIDSPSNTVMLNVVLMIDP